MDYLLKIKNWLLFTKVLFGVYFWTSNLSAQINLVPNSSFESYTSCPSFPGQVEFAFPWFNPTNDSPDYFNACNTFSIGVPQNFMGFQYPRTGSANMGLYVDDAMEINRREYIEVELSQALVAGKKYNISYYIVGTTGGGDVGASDNIGCALTIDSLIDYSTIYALNVTSFFYTSSIITDTLNWSKIEFLYTAIGGERFLTIGNFLPDSLNHTINILDPADTTTDVSVYYYIDDVFVGLADTTGVDEQNFSVEDFKIYPNPSNSVLVIESELLNTSIIITDVLGKQVKQFYTVQKRTEISIADLSQGIYFVRSKNCVKKLIVER